jgi:5-methylcytosine-specific restriction endonuclease McrA
MDYSSYPSNRADAKTTGAKYYFTGEPCKHGHVALRKTKGSCVECLKVEWGKGNATRSEYFKQYNQSDAGKEAKKKYYAENKEAVIARANARPVEERRQHREKYKKQNPELYKAFVSVRKRRHKKATPPWVTPEQKLKMRQLYLEAMKLTKLTGERYVVDHIIPLINPEVCGLHVPWNLQVMTQEKNLKKSNKILDTAHEQA